MVYSLTYRRPAHVTSSTDSLSDDEKHSSIQGSITSGSSGVSGGIPDALSFDRIVANGACPPCTVRDFLNYLKYIEHAAENLQFFLWYQDYVERFNHLQPSEQALSPEWTKAQAEAEATAAQQSRTKKANAQVTVVFKHTDFADASNKASVDPFNDTTSDYGSSTGGQTFVSTESARETASQAYSDAGMQWQPFAMQPYRDEISRIITVYIVEGAPRQLNLSSREKQALLQALRTTTHPSAVRGVLTTVEYSLRKQAHPNFIRWTICNGNRPRVIFARGLGIATIMFGLIADVLITLSHAGRGWRIIPFAGWFIGIATLIAAWKGMCVVLHGMHHRHLRPWELFSDSTEDLTDEKNMSRETFHSTISTANSFEDEPWVPKYMKRNLIRKIFDREVWIQEPALRQIQDTIFLQAVLAAFALSAVAVGVFCALPNGNFI